MKSTPLSLCLKFRTPFWLVCATLLASIAPKPSARAAILYWDSNGATAGAGVTPTGTWGTNSFWSTNSAGTLATTAYTAGSDVVFSAGTDATGSATITVSGAQTAASLSIEEGTLIFAGTATPGLSLGTGGLTMAGTAVATFGSTLPITLSGAQSWTNNSSGLLTVSTTVAQGTNALTITGTGATTIGGIISGSGGIVKTGTGTLTLSAANTFTGGLNIKAGTVIGSTNAASFGASTSTITLGDTTGTAAAALLATGTGATFANPLTIASGSSGLATMGVNNGSSFVFSGATTLNKTLTINSSGAGTLNLSGVISGAGGLSVTAGTLIVGNAANTFTGNVAVNGSTAVLQMTSGSNGTATAAPLGLVSATAFKTVTLSNGGTFRPTASYNDNAPTAALPGNGYVFSIGSGGGTFDVATGVTLTIDDGSGAGTGIANTQLQGSGTLTKIGAGTLSLGNAAASNAVFTGQILVNAGILKLGSVTAAGVALGATTAGTVIASGAAFDVGLNLGTAAEPLSINGSGVGGTTNVIFTSGTATTPIFAGPITLAGNSTIGTSTAGTITFTSTGTFALGANALTIRNTGTGRIFTDGVISGTGSVVMNSSSTGDYVPRTDHTYSGGTTLTAGFIAVDRDSIGTPGSPTSGPFGTGTLTIAGGQLRAGTTQNRTVGNAVTISGDTAFYTAGSEKTLTFSGPITLSGGTRTLTANVGATVAATSTVFSGAVGDGGSNLGLTKAGTGNLTLGGVNTYTGATTVNAGTLILTGSLATNTALSVVPTVAGGANFTLASGAANPLGSISTLTLGSATGTTFIGLDLGAASDSLTTANAVANNAIAFNLNSISGFGAGTYNLINAVSGLTSTGATYSLNNVPGGYTFGLTATDSLVQLNATLAAAGTLYWRGNANNGWSSYNAGNTNWFTDSAGTTNAAGTPGAQHSVVFSTTNATGPVLSTTLDNAVSIQDLQFTSNPTGVTTVNVAPGLAPGGNLGSLTLTPATSATGIAVAANAGNVTISAPVILGAPQTWSADGTGANGSTLTVSGGITGAAANSLTIGGLVTLSAAGTSTYSGSTTVPNGAILQGGATNSFSANSATAVTGTGILRLNGLSNTIGALSGDGIIQNNHASTAATLTVGDATNTTFSGILQNGGVGTLGLTKNGAGSLTLTGTNTFSGAVTVNAGSLVLGSANAITAANPVTLAGTGTLDIFGNSFNIGALTSAVTTSVITNSSTSTAASTATALNTPSGSGVYVDALTTATGVGISSLITDGATRKTQIVINNANGGALFTNAGNTFSGGIVLQNNATGTRLSPGVVVAGAYGTGPIIIGQAATDKAGIFFANATSFSNPIIFNTALGTDRVGIRAEAAVTLSGVITANLAPATFTSNNATLGAFTLTNQVTGASGLVLDIVSLSAAATSFSVTLNNATANANNYQGDTVINFNATTAKSATLALGAADQIPNGTGTGNVIINTNGTGVGTLNLAGFSDTINGLSGNGTVEGASGTPTLSVGDNNATATFSGIIKNATGALALTKVGTGTQTLTGTSTFTGAITVNGGLLAFPSSPSSNGPLGNSAAVNLNGGGLSYTSTGTNALNRTVAIGAGNGTFNVASSTGILTALGTNVTSSGGNLVKTGPGTLSLSGTTTLNGGNAAVLVNDGTLLAGFGTAGINAITVGATGVLNFQNSTIQALTLGSTGTVLNLSSGARLGFELDGATNDSITVPTGGGLTLGGTYTFDFANLNTGVAANTYTLLTAPTGSALNTYSYLLGNAPNGFNYSFNSTDTLVQLIATAYVPIYWRGGQDLSWNTLGASTANWTSDSGGSVDSAHKPQANETVIFSATGTPTSSNTITTSLDAAFTIDSLQFTNVPTGITSVTINGGPTDVLTITPASTSGGIKILTGGGNATITAPLIVGAAQTWGITDASSTLTVSGNTVFNATVTQNGAGSVTLSGNNSGTGAYILSSGKLNLNSATALGGTTLSIGAGTTIDATSGVIALSTNNVQNWNGDFTFAGTNNLDLGTGAVALGNSLTVTTTANTLTVGGIIGDGGNARSLTKVGAGTLTLTGANTYTGGTILTTGTLNLTGNNSFGSGGVTINGGTATISGNNAYTGGTTVNSGALTLSGANNFGVGGVTINGGTTTISGANTYTGGTTLTAGTLNLGNAGAIGTGTLVIAGGTLDNTSGSALALTGNNPQTWNGNVSFTGTNNLDLGTGAVSLTGTRTATVTANTLTVGGIISGVGLTKAGVGTLTLGGTNTYTAATAISGGVLRITNGSALGTTAAGTTVAASTALEIDGTAGAVSVGAEAININGGGFSTFNLGAIRNIAGNNTYGGTVTMAAQSRINSDSGTLTLNNPTAVTGAFTLVVGGAGNITISGAMTNGTGGISKDGTGTVILSGVNTNTGPVLVNAGALTLSGNRTAAVGTVTVGSALATAATLNVSAGTFTTGAMTVGSGDNPLTAGTVNQTGGTLTLSGNQLLLGNGGTGTTSGSNSTGTYTLSGGELRPIAGTLGVVLGTNTGTTGNFNLSGTGFLNMPATSTMQIGRSDNSAATNTTGVFTQTGGIATVGILQMSGTAAAAVNGAGANSTLDLSGGIFSAVTFNALSGGNSSTSTIKIGGTAQVTLPVFPTNVKGTSSTATITFDSTTGFLSPGAASATYMPAGTFTNAYLTANGAKFNVPTAKDITIGQVLADAVSPAATGTLAKSGVGALTLSGANTFTGGVTLNAGILGLGDNAALGNGTITINGGNIRAVNAARALSNPVTVNGDFILGRLTDLNGAITLTTDATITASNPDAVANNDSKLGAVGGNFRLTLAEGSGGAVAPFGIGTGAIVINAVNTNTGGTTLASGRATVSSTGALANADLVVNAGELNLNNTAQTVTALSGTGGTINLATGNTLTVNQSTNTTYAGVIASSGALTKSGNGNLTLTGANTYAGKTTISDGTLSLNGAGALADTGAVELTSVTSVFNIAGINASEKIATLDGLAGSSVVLGGKSLELGNGTGAYAGNISGTSGSLTKSGTGVQTLSGNNTYTGSTSISGGTLLLGSNTALPSTASLSLSGGTLQSGAFSGSTGELTVTAASTIDMNDAASVLTFANTGTWTGLLSVWNYTGGAIWTASTGDKLLFTSGSINPNLVQFYSDNGGTQVGIGGDLIPSGAGFELVPVPEASTALGAMALLGLVGYRERRRFFHRR